MKQVLSPVNDLNGHEETLINFFESIDGAPDASREELPLALMDRSGLTSIPTLPGGLASSVLLLKEQLLMLKEKVDGVELSLSQMPAEERIGYEKQFADLVGKGVQRRVMPEINALFAQLKSEPAEIKEELKAFIHSQLNPLFHLSEVFRRVYTKPLGYAGDFEMMNISYRNGFDGETLFSRCLHRFYMMDPATVSLRNRVVYLMNHIQNVVNKAPAGGIVKIMSLACGPAKEIEILLADRKFRQDVRIEIDLLDQEPTAIASAENAMEPHRKANPNVSIRYIQASVKNVIGGCLDEKYDFIYTAGLFDYLNDRVSTVTAKVLTKALNKNGTLIIGNERSEFPSEPFMDLILDWCLIYRSAADLERLFGSLPGEGRVESEALGINLFYVLERH